MKNLPGIQKLQQEQEVEVLQLLFPSLFGGMRELNVGLSISLEAIEIVSKVSNFFIGLKKKKEFINQTFTLLESNKAKFIFGLNLCRDLILGEREKSSPFRKEYKGLAYIPLSTLKNTFVRELVTQAQLNKLAGDIFIIECEFKVESLQKKKNEIGERRLSYTNGKVYELVLRDNHCSCFSFFDEIDLVVMNFGPRGDSIAKSGMKVSLTKKLSTLSIWIPIVSVYQDKESTSGSTFLEIAPIAIVDSGCFYSNFLFKPLAFTMAKHLGLEGPYIIVSSESKVESTSKNVKRVDFKGGLWAS